MPAMARRVLFVTGDVAGHRGGALPRGDRLPLARQAVPAEGSAARRARDGRLSVRLSQAVESQRPRRSPADRRAPAADSCAAAASAAPRSAARTAPAPPALGLQHDASRLRHPPSPCAAAHRLLEREDRGLDRLLGEALGAERLLQPLNGARVELRDARFVDADLGADLLHRRFAVVVEADDLALARRQRRDRGADAVAHFAAPRTPCRATAAPRAPAPAGSDAPSTFSPADSGDVDSMVLMRTIVRPRRASSEPDPRREVRQRRLGAELAPQLLARRFELAALTADAARPGVAAERVDHRAAHPPLGEGLELDARALVEAAGRVDEPDHAVLHQVAELDRMRHRGRHAARERLDERQSGGNAIAMVAARGWRCMDRFLRGCCRHNGRRGPKRNRNASERATQRRRPFKPGG